ncbi:putative oxidoreductase [Parvularcula bermudensis HTCC2503]|uniref:Putative oxidoreductase n=1 Tax=Parvularcula bermudensis (strain ATCC BAA-594 / HTCC2503 / KCTC 12087) TaxID=314260 RepID=E0TB64_PARBH|nr:FAD-dependent oxidoreductase [Parvularcula bermudensis]ADM08268.1 putative oxidoreductase [Parvularcula bermudensis HTCC2503]
MSTDTLIIGDGLIGMAVGWALAEAGQTVTVLGQSEMTGSLAAAGMLAPSFEAQHPRAAPGLADLLYESLTLWSGFHDRLVKASGLTLDYRREGIIALADRQAPPPVAGPPIAVPEGFATLGPACLIADEGQVDPRRVHGALATALAKAGGQRRGGRVEALDLEAGAALLSDGSRVSAARFVIAAGVGSAALLAGDLPKLTSVRGRAVLVEWPGFPTRHVVRTADLYFCPKADGRLYVGATEEPAMAEEGALARLWERAVALLPDLEGRRILARFDGHRPALATGTPLIGLHGDDPRLIVAYGHDRNGILLTPVTVERVLRLIGGLPRFIGLESPLE